MKEKKKVRSTPYESILQESKYLKEKGAYVIDKLLKNDSYLIKDVEGFQLSRCPYQGHNNKHRIGKRI